MSTSFHLILQHFTMHHYISLHILKTVTSKSPSHHLSHMSTLPEPLRLKRAEAWSPATLFSLRPPLCFF